ncbi:MAG: AMP-binding protein [bacterium]
MSGIGERIIEVSHRQGEKQAFIFHERGEEQSLSYNGFRRLIAGFSAAIQSTGIPPHSRVFLVGENSPRWPAAYLAAHLCGHTVIHGDVRFTEREYAAILDFMSPALILCGKGVEDMFRNRRPVILLEDIPPAPSEQDPDVLPLKPDQPMSVLLTSGTTGTPKGVMLSESNFVSNLRMFEAMHGLITSKDRVVAILPFHHVYPFTCTVLAPLYFGATLILPASLRGEDIFGAVRRHNGTILLAIPRVLELFCTGIVNKVRMLPRMKRFVFHTLFSLSGLLRDIGIRGGRLLFPSVHRNFPSFRFFACGGAPLDTRIHTRLAKLGFIVVEAYGLSETSPIAAINDPRNPVPGSVGRAAPGVEIRIDSADPQAREGEILIKGPNVMMGYYKRPDLTERVVTDGWFHSGDLGYLDRSGHLYITGRKDEMIVLSSGKNIYPEELEKEYADSEKIQEICITLLKEGERESLTAVVYPNRDYFIRNKNANVFQEIKFDIETAGQRLPSHKRVSRIELVDKELPRTSLGKIKRYTIPQMIARRERPQKQTREEAHEEQEPFLRFVRDFLKLDRAPVPRDNLETDLGLDSLSKMEFFAAVEKRYGIPISDETASGLFTLNDVKRLIPEASTAAGMNNEGLLEDMIPIPPDPPLEHHVSTRQGPVGTLLRFCFHLLCRILMKLFFNAELHGKEHLEALNPPFVIAPNHASLIDSLVIYGLFPFGIINRCFFVSIPLYFGIFPLSLLRRIGRVILTGTWDTAVRSLQYAYQVLRTGGIMCVFPEGARSIDGTIQKPKRGMGNVAKKAGAPFLPVYIDGSMALLSRKNPGFRRACLNAHILPPLFPEGPVDDFLDRWQKELQCRHDMLTH